MSLINLITLGGTDSTWINNNHPQTFNTHYWYSDSGWVNVIDSELLLLWIMRNIEEREGSNLENIIYSIQQFEIAQPSSQKNFILTEGELVYAYRSENDAAPDLFFSDNTPIQTGDSTYTPNFISILSEIPPDEYTNLLNWSPFGNESLMVIDNYGNITIHDNFINHHPYFDSYPIIDTISIDSTYLFSFSALDIDGDSLTFQLINNPSWAQINGQQLAMSPNETGIFQFQITVSDGELSGYLDITLTIASYYPNILSINDVPNDGGGWVYVTFSRSFYDTGNLRDIEIYHIERLTNAEWG